MQPCVTLGNRILNTRRIYSTPSYEGLSLHEPFKGLGRVQQTVCVDDTWWWYSGKVIAIDDSYTGNCVLGNLTCIYMFLPTFWHLYFIWRHRLSDTKKHDKTKYICTIYIHIEWTQLCSHIQQSNVLTAFDPMSNLDTSFKIVLISTTSLALSCDGLLVMFANLSIILGTLSLVINAYKI